MGLGDWPAAETAYRIGGAGTRPELAVIVSAQLGVGLSGPNEAADVTARLAADHAERYRRIGEQLDEPGLTVSLRTSLDPSQPLPLADGAASLRRFARSAELFAHAAAAATAPELTGIATLGELLDRFGLTADRLSFANYDQPLNRLLAAGQPLARRTGQAEPNTVPTGPSTLGEVTGPHMTMGQLLEDNRGLRLAADPAVVLPGIASLPAEARTPYSVQAGDTLAMLARRFGSTPRALVAANAQVVGTLPPGTRVEVPVVSGTETALAGTDTLAGDSFAAVCDRLASQRADVSLDAVADALDRLGPVLDPGSVLSCPLAVLGSGRDDAGPLTTAQAAADFGCPPAAFAVANATLLGLLQPGVELSHGDRTTTTTESDTLYAVLGRLEPGSLQPSIYMLDRLLDDHSTVPLFRAGARALLPPVPVTITAVPGHALAPDERAGPLTMTLRLARSHAAQPGAITAEHADTRVPPGQSWDDLITACLAVLPAVRLATVRFDKVWMVPFGPGGISGVRIEALAAGSPARALAVRPLYRRLLDFTASIRTVGLHGHLDGPIQRQFSQVDVEPWARLFVADLDRYLTEPVAGGLLPNHVERLTEIRRQVAGAIADGLEPLLQGDPAADAALPNARAALASMGSAGLGSAYLASVVAQYPAVTTSPYGDDSRPAAWLAGTARTPDRPDLGSGTSRTALAPADASCSVALSCADPAGAADVSFRLQHDFDGLDLAPAGPDELGSATLLQFGRALTGAYRPEAIVADLPAVELPVPLREHPAPVGVRPMTAAATLAGPGRPTPAEAARWTASLSYTHPHAAQDVVWLAVSDQPPEPAATADLPPAPGSTALAEALAGYVTAVADLSPLVTPGFAPNGVPDLYQIDAADSLVELAAAVATAWSDHWTEPAPVAPASARPNGAAAGGGATGDARLVGGYQLRAVYTDQGSRSRLLDRLVVSRTGAGADWPLLTVDCGDGQLPLTPGPVSGDTCDYLPADRPEVAGPLEVRLDWPGLRAVPRPAARITLTVERNAMLRAGMPTPPEFVLATVPVEITAASPALRWDEELQLTGANLGEALQNAFDDLSAGQPDCVFSVEVGYAESAGDLETVVPALLLSQFSPTAGSGAGIADNLIWWQRGHRWAPVPAAQWRLRLALLSLQDGEPPLVTFERLVFPVSAADSD